MDEELSQIIFALEAFVAPEAREVAQSKSPQRQHAMLSVNGEIRTRAEWARRAGISADMLRKRIGRGMTPEEAVKTEWTPRNKKPKSETLLLVAAAKDQSCFDCKNKFPTPCMDFDHIRGEKIFELSKARKYSYEVVRKEIAKCELVCANCHRIRTALRAAASRGIKLVL